MSKRPFDTNQNKMSRTDRFAQMSQQELIIEQKKKEIQAKLEAKRKQITQNIKDKVIENEKTKSTPAQEDVKPVMNQFINDGSFLDHFKQLNEKKKDSKFKTFNRYKDKIREREKDKEKTKDNSKDIQLDLKMKNDSLANDQPIHHRQSRFSSEQPINFDQNKITFNPTFTSNPPPLPVFNQSSTIQHHQPITNSPKTLISQITSAPPLVSEYPVNAQINFSTVETPNFTPTGLSRHLNTNIAPPVTQIISSAVTQQLNPPQTLIQPQIGIVAQTGNDSVQNISATLPTIQQTQTVMTQGLTTSTHLFNPATGADQIVSTPPPVLLNVPPPQIMPQTQIVITPQDQNVLVSAPTSILTTVTIPPPVITPQNLNISTSDVLSVPPPSLSTVELTSIPPPNPIQIQNIPQPEPINTMNIPPPAPLQVSNIPTPSSLQLNEIPNPKPLDLMAIPTPTENSESIVDTNILKNIPPPNKSLPPPNVADLNFLNSQSTQPPPVPVAALVQSPNIPSLMSQRVLPPPGIRVNVPPPIIHTRDVSQPPPNFNLQAPPPIINVNIPPPMIGPPATIFNRSGFKEEISGGADFEAMANLARMVAECGPSVEDVVRQKKNRDPELWFLFHKDSAAYRQYASLVQQYKIEREESEKKTRIEVKTVDGSEKYEPEMALEDDEFDQDISPNVEIKLEPKQEDQQKNYDNGRKERKRKSRWGDKDDMAKPPPIAPLVVPSPSLPLIPGSSPMLTKVIRSDPGLLQYALQSYGSTNLSEEDWKKVEDNYKIHLLYQDMLKKREELEKLQKQGKNKYDYDSDEDTEGGTWEHKLREKEMQATELWATELNRQAEGKHHIGDFLPPEEFKRFMEKSNAVKEGRQPNFSDYKEFKIKEDNIGFKMLQKLGWSEGQGLGQNNMGIVEPINK
ncbi:hypothetical protein ABEB36_003754 [Hypothenemus hampei]|uniref:G-patch domain-containing protein n=1 Tax=Hypothenemus hampei TaxID=57062 RepID=A0ABD1F4T8_HYPHA